MGVFFFFSSRRRHTTCLSDWSSDVCSFRSPGPCHLARGASISWAGGQEQSRERRGRLTPPQLAILIRRGAKSDVSPPPTHLWRDAVPPGPRVPARVCGCATIHTVTRRAAGGGARRVTPVPAHGL